MTRPRAPLATVEQVRAELRRLGYLDSGLDRFVLTAAGSPSPLSASLSASLRVGLVGGLLFGAALSLAAAGLDRRLLAQPQDLAVLAAYLVLVLGAGCGAAAFLGGLAAAWYGRRLGRRADPRLSRNIGLALAVGGLAYLALWWRSHAAALPTAARIIAVALALGLSLALARFGALAAVAVLSAGGVGDRLPQASLSRRRMLPLVGSVAILFSGGVAAASYFGGGPAGPGPDLTVVPTGLRVRVLGIDGLDPAMARQMVARGEMPRLGALLASGARARLKVESEQVPALVWTTVATGRGPAAHGIQSTRSRRLAGMRTPVPLGERGPLGRALGRAAGLLRITRDQPPTSVLRVAKAFWNVASESGLRVGVVNWWASWPADPVNGYVVTDRAFFKLTKGGPLDREVHPPAAYERLKRLGGDHSEDRARSLDRFHLAAALELRRSSPPDLEAVYLPGLDIFTVQQLGAGTGADLAAVDARLDAVRGYYRFVDGLLGQVLDSLAAGEVLLLVGDPGRLARRSSAAPEGLLLATGAAIRPGELEAADERDVAPTVLHLAGLAVSRELEGRALEEALGPEFRRAHPVRFVATYGRRPPSAPAPSSFDPEMLEQLRSLGYVE